MKTCLSPSVPWRYRIVTRQTVPILIGLAGLLLLLIALGYFFAREQILNTVNAQVRQFVNSIQRESDTNRQMLIRSMPILLQKVERAGHVSDSQAFGKELLASMPEVRDKVMVEIVTITQQNHISLPNTAPVASANISQELQIYLLDSKGFISQKKITSSLSGHHAKVQVEAVKSAYWPSPQIDAKRMLHLRYSAPLRNDVGKTYGIITVSLAIPWFMERIRSFSFFKQCIPFFLTTSGDWTLPSSADTELKELKTLMLKEESKFNTVQWGEKRFVPIMLPRAEPGLFIGVLVPYADLFGYLDTISKTLIILGLIVLLLAAYVLRKTCHSLLSPLIYLAKMAEKLSQGKIDSQLIIPNNSQFLPETEKVLVATKQLGTALQQRMHDLTVMTKTTERMYGELELARTIQSSLYPAHLPQIPNISLAAAVHPAQEVCGDIYDCFALSEHEVCFIMGNVSERGIAAALLSNRTLPLLHELLLSGLSPAKALQNVNACFDSPLSSNLSTSKDAPVITSFVGILHGQSGVLRFASAGQWSPYIVGAMPKQNSPLSCPQQLQNAHEQALGSDMQNEYTQMTVSLLPGQTLFFIPKRLLLLQNEQLHSYGQVGLAKFFATNHLTPQELVNAFYQDITDFTANNIHDDVVLFAIKLDDYVKS